MRLFTNIFNLSPEINITLRSRVKSKIELIKKAARTYRSPIIINGSNLVIKKMLKRRVPITNEYNAVALVVFM